MRHVSGTIGRKRYCYGYEVVGSDDDYIVELNTLLPPYTKLSLGSGTTHKGALWDALNRLFNGE